MHLRAKHRRPEPPDGPRPVRQGARDSGLRVTHAAFKGTVYRLRASLNGDMLGMAGAAADTRGHTKAQKYGQCDRDRDGNSHDEDRPAHQRTATIRITTYHSYSRHCGDSPISADAVGSCGLTASTSLAISRAADSRPASRSTGIASCRTVIPIG